MDIQDGDCLTMSPLSKQKEEATIRIILMATKNSENLAEKKSRSLPWIGWTTTDSSESAHNLAHQAVEAALVACAQVEPITSYYRWQGKLESAHEYRITFKFSGKKRRAVQEWIIQNHPYKNPQWLSVRAVDATDAYIRWIETGE